MTDSLTIAASYAQITGTAILVAGGIWKGSKWIGKLEERLEIVERKLDRLPDRTARKVNGGSRYGQ